MFVQQIESMKLLVMSAHFVKSLQSLKTRTVLNFLKAVVYVVNL